MAATTECSTMDDEGSSSSTDLDGGLLSVPTVLPGADSGPSVPATPDRQPHRPPPDWPL